MTRVLAVLLCALPAVACGYPDVALKPPERAPTLSQSSSESAPVATIAEQPDDTYGFGRPFVVIRFGPEPVDFEEPLAGAVAEARAKRPDVRFQLLAVAAGGSEAGGAKAGGSEAGGSPSLGHAEAVLRSLAALGVPPGDVAVSAVAAPTKDIDEVRLYLR